MLTFEPKILILSVTHLNVFMGKLKIGKGFKRSPVP